jgi:hypothetical protein
LLNSEKNIVNEDDLPLEKKVSILEGKIDFIIRNMGDESNLNSKSADNF